MILVSAVSESLRLAYDIVYLEPDKAPSVRERHVENIVVATCIAAVFIKGTLYKEPHAENILVRVVAAAKLNSGTVCRETQVENMLAISVTEDVINRGTWVKE